MHSKLGVFNNFIKAKSLLHINDVLIVYTIQIGTVQMIYFFLILLGFYIGEMVSRRLPGESVEFSKLLFVNFCYL